MKRIIFVRHGVYDNNLQLSPEGAKEIFARARLLAADFAPADIILSSPAERCLQTAAVIALAFGNPPVQTENLLAEENAPLAQTCRSMLAAETEVYNRRTVIVVSHFPNIKNMFGVDLRPGTELIFSADDRQHVFDPNPANWLSLNRGKLQDESVWQRYFFPACDEEELAVLRQLDFLRGRL